MRIEKKQGELIYASCFDYVADFSHLLISSCRSKLIGKLWLIEKGL
uniref:Uncharacterized protein n=1 Tax=Manihot esculenta TaxID=3983 RepID=A0A2C9UUI6_MANES